MSIRSSVLCVLCASVVNCCVVSAEAIRCPCTRDVWLSSVGGEADTNGGKAQRIKLKIYQEFGLLDFDVSELKGKRIESAKLYIATAGGGNYGGDRATDLRWFTLSSVSSPWEEGLGAQYAKDDAGHGATFNEASFKTRPWTVRGSKCFDAILGNGNSVRCDVDGGEPKNGWFALPIDKKLIEALVAQTSYGIAILDGNTGLNSNCSIATRESKNAPYLMVNYYFAKTIPPTPPEKIEVTPAPNEASAESGTVKVSFTVPLSVFAYRIKTNGIEVPRWQIPLAKVAGEQQSFFLRDLPSDADVKFEFVGVDSAGHESDPRVVTARSSPRITVPAFPTAPPVTKTAIAATPRAWALPELCKIDPLTGEAILDHNLKDARAGNSIWNAETKTVSLSCARGEIAGFQLAFEPEQGPADVRISIEGLGGAQPRIWREWFVKIGKQWHAEYAIPTKENSIAVPAPDNKVEGQKFGAAAIDLIVPANVKPGEMRGTIKISGVTRDEITLALNLKIHNATIPGEMHFFPELNCYGGPGQAGSEFFFDSHRLAHYHRNVINRVPYSQRGDVHGDMVPKVGADGRVTDWAEYDKNVGPLLDGSAFKDNPRAGVPTPMLYLPLNENWPLPMQPHYHTGPTDGEHWKALHDIQAKSPEAAFDQQYKDAFFACSADFVKHFEEKQWTRTMSQGFLNNKWHFSKTKLGGTAWTMDEPSQWLDWQALLFYSNIFHKAFANAKNSQFVFRGDISRPQWQGNCMDGKMEILYANSEQFSMFPLMRDMKQRSRMQLICYGACNANDRSNCETTAWCLKSYCFDCDGVVPWQSLGGDSAFEKGDSHDNGNALIVDGRKRFSVNAIASFRVHAMRSGAQLAELLRLLEIKRGWGRMHSRALVSQLIPLDAQFKQGFADDAAALKFEKVSADDLVRLKNALLRLLED